ncbi:MAG: diacylglycerol kinase family protein [bacterium]|nr:diacylglycerol kinase family protein [Candidatus Margulisiibacteriota bacterium]
MPRKIIKSIKHAKSGMEHALRSERNLSIHFLLGAIVLAVGGWLEVSFYELSLLVIVISMVIVAETFNTAIEELVNILSPGQREEAALAKNVAAAAVLLAALGAMVVGGLIFLPKIF